MIETERLLLRRWRLPLGPGNGGAGDLEALAEMYADPAVMRYIGDGSVRTRAETAAAMVRYEQDWARLGFGLFAVELRDGGELAGWVGLAEPEFLPEIMPSVEIGWRLGRAYWGRGIATEAARAVLGFAFDYARLPRVVSIAAVENAASLAVMGRLGMAIDRETVVPAHGRRVIVTTLARAQYLRAAGR